MVQSGFEFLISCLCLPNAGVPGVCHCDCLLLLGVCAHSRESAESRKRRSLWCTVGHWFYKVSWSHPGARAEWLRYLEFLCLTLSVEKEDVHIYVSYKMP